MGWEARKGADVTFKAWYGGHGLGRLRLFRFNPSGGPFVLVAENSSVAQPLIVVLPPQEGTVKYCLQVFNQSLDEDAKPVFVVLSQGNNPLSSENPASGAHGDVRLEPVAPFNSPKSYYFDLAFV